MTDQETAARQIALAKLNQSRAEFRAILDPPPQHTEAAEQGAFAAGSQFPRSKTMQMLMSGKGLGTIGALAGGLLVARPALALRLLRLVPASSVAKMLLAKAVTSLRGRQA